MTQPPSDPPKNSARSRDPLHGITLQVMVEGLVEALGFEELGRQIDIRCFNVDPSVSSSLKFLRRTPWARTKVENLYLHVCVRKGKITPRS